jgi:hypothetical protein
MGIHTIVRADEAKMKIICVLYSLSFAVVVCASGVSTPCLTYIHTIAGIEGYIKIVRDR